VYGLTEVEFNQIIVYQLGRCVICQDTFIGMPHVYHNHSTGRIRGLLCAPCNKGIGLLRDDPNLMRKAIYYLEKESV